MGFHNSCHSLGERLSLQALDLTSPHLSTHVNPALSELFQDLVNVEGVVSAFFGVLFIGSKRCGLPLSLPLLHSFLRRLGLILDVGGNHVEARTVLVLHLRLEEADIRELGKLVEKGEAVPGLGLVHQDNHATTRLEAREGYRQLRCLQAVSLTVLAIGRNLVSTEDTALASSQIESLRRSDGSFEEALGVRMVRRDLVQRESEVSCQHCDICLYQVQSWALDKTIHPLLLDRKGDSDHLNIGVDLQSLTNEAARRKAQGKHARSFAREGKDASGLLHFVSDALHHSEKDLGRLWIRVIAELSLALKVGVSLRIVPALRSKSQ